MGIKSSLLLVLVLASSGCASSLKTYDADGNQTRGLPVRTPVMVEVERVSTYQLVSGVEDMRRYCTPDTVISREFLPLGELVYLNLDPATFGKSDFKVELTDAGALKSVSLGSDPGTPSVIEATTAALSAVLPFIAVPKESEAEPSESVESVQAARDRHCAKMKTAVTRVERKELN